MPDSDADGCESDCGEEVPCELVVAGCDAPEMFDLIEEALDEVALAIEIGVDATNDPHVTLAWDVSGGAESIEEFDDCSGAIAAIGNRMASRPQALDQAGQRRFVGSLAGRQEEADRQAHMVDDGMDLGRQSSTRTANGVIRAPFF